MIVIVMHLPADRHWVEIIMHHQFITMTIESPSYLTIFSASIASTWSLQVSSKGKNFSPNSFSAFADEKSGPGRLIPWLTTSRGTPARGPTSHSSHFGAVMIGALTFPGKATARILTRAIVDGGMKGEGGF